MGWLGNDVAKILSCPWSPAGLVARAQEWLFAGISEIPFRNKTARRAQHFERIVRLTRYALGKAMRSYQHERGAGESEIVEKLSWIPRFFRGSLPSRSPLP